MLLTDDRLSTSCKQVLNLERDVCNASAYKANPAHLVASSCGPGLAKASSGRLTDLRPPPQPMVERNSVKQSNVKTAGCSSVARGAIGGDLDQVLQLTDDFVGAILSWVQYSRVLHPFHKGLTLCIMGAILLLACLLTVSPSLPCFLGETHEDDAMLKCEDCIFWVISQLVVDGFG